MTINMIITSQGTSGAFARLLRKRELHGTGKSIWIIGIGNEEQLINDAFDNTIMFTLTGEL